MLINRISINSYRNIDKIEFKLANNNLIYGNNGAGKTNILDAFYILGYGKSFHISQTKYLIKHNKDSFTIFADINNIENIDTVAISKNSKGIKTSKINGCKVTTQSQISIHLPIVSITPDSIKTLTGTNSEKRSFINLCMFHVEPLFIKNWKKYNQLLKQRNIILKNKNFEALNVWDIQIDETANILDSAITKLITQLTIKLNYYTKKILFKEQFLIDYARGWDSNKPLIDVFNDNCAKDIKYGFTTSGIHRYKIKYLLNNKDIKEIFSRAECKLFLYCLYLSLVDILKNKQVLLLIDDPLSELDEANCDKIFTLLEALDIQKIITTSILPTKLYKTFKMFHVEHGSLKSE